MAKKKKFDLGGANLGGNWSAQLGPTVVTVSDVKTDPMFQHRAHVDERIIEDYTEILKEGGELAAIKLVRDGATLWLIDGHQTLEAAKRAGVSKLKAEIERGSKREAWFKSLKANFDHGVRRSREDLAKAIRDAISDQEIRSSLLAEDGQYTYSSVAKLIKTSHTSIRNHWLKYVPEINKEIDEALAQYPDMIAPQTEIAALVAKELHIPPWIVEQRQIEVAFNLQDEQEPSSSELARTPVEPPTPKPPLHKDSKLPRLPTESAPPESNDELVGSRKPAPTLDEDSQLPREPIESAKAEPPTARVKTKPESDLKIPPPSPMWTVEELDDYEFPDEDNEEVEEEVLPLEPQTTKNPLHLSESNEWYTPAKYVEAARRVLGTIDLDPASCELANQTVKADFFFTAEDDGLKRKWWGNVFLNPPYSETKGQSNQAAWSKTLIEKYESDEIEAGILLVNATPSNKWFAALWDYTICFTDHRIKFYDPSGDIQEYPPHSNAFVYLGPDRDKFADLFEEFGVIAVRYKK